MATTTRTTVSLELTPEQAITVHAALCSACNFSRKMQLQMMALHESKIAGPVTRAEAWKTYRTWEKRETETAELMTALKKGIGGDLPFSAFSLFD